MASTGFLAASVIGGANELAAWHIETLRAPRGPMIALGPFATILRMPPDSSPTKLAWHYTTAQGLLSILATNRLWASAAAFMNDVEEMRTGRQALIDYIESQTAGLKPWQRRQIAQLGLKQASAPHTSFLLSAALDGDLLTLWRNYGGDQVAYSLGLERSFKLLPIEQSDEVDHPHPPRDYYEDARIDIGAGETIYNDPDSVIVFGGRWKQVTYIAGARDSAVKREFQRLLMNLSEPTPGQMRLPFLTYSFVDSPTNTWKHKGFEDEREVRAAWSVEPSWKFVKFRAERFGVVPHIEVSHSNDARRDHIPRGAALKLPIRAVTIGPSPFGDDAAKALRTLLDDTGYGEVSIRRSVTPFR